jgi:hypothetical protein
MTVVWSFLAWLPGVIAHWNTVYIKRAIHALARNGIPPEPALFHYLSPLGWGTSNSPATTKGELRPLRISNSD